VARPSLEVRRGRADDLDDLLELLLAARDDATPGFRTVIAADPQVLRRRLVRLLDRTSGSDLLVAWQDHRPVGFLLLGTGPVSPLADGSAMHIDQLYVVPDQRRHGVGRALISAIAGLAERAGADQVLCNVSPLARDTHRFFARLGFAPLMVRRAVPLSTLRRRLAGGESRRSGLDELLSRRRSLRARSLWPGSRADRSEAVAEPAEEPADGGAGAEPAEVSVPSPAAPPTLELPVIQAEAALEVLEAETVGPPQ
jgi:GNAT superfamily N-acetyltransferase